MLSLIRRTWSQRKDYNLILVREMKVLYLLSGIACVGLGGFLLWSVAGKFKRKVPDELGYNAKGIMAGI